MENPLSRIPNRSDLPKGPSLRQLASQYIPEPVKETGRLAEMIGKSAADFAFGEDSGLPLAESLIPGAELVSKVSQGKRPGALDVTDVVPGVGSLKTIGAMGPIVGTLKELKGGGRLGKIARNVDKAKDARKYVTAYHKTMNEKVPSIDKEGLKLQHQDYGTNTSDAADYTPVIWLSGHPTFIPVLRRFGDGLDETTTYKVKIPRKEFYETPRMMMPYGRSGPKIMAKKGESSWSKEAHKYVINTYGKDIPPEYLEKMDATDRLASILKTDRQNIIRDKLADLVESWDIPSDILIKYGVTPSENFIRFDGRRPASNSQLGNIVQDEMRTNFPPVTERKGFGIADASAAASKVLANGSGGRYNLSPFNVLEEIIDKNPFIPRIPPFKSRLELTMNPPEADPVLDFKPGAISRGLDESPYLPKDRLFDWASYNDSRASGMSPMEATVISLPRFVYKNGDPEKVYSGFGMDLAKGSISRGAEGPEVGLSAFLTSKEPDKSDVISQFRHFMHNPRTDYFGNINSKLYEQAATVKGPYGNFLRNIVPKHDVMMRASVGSIGRGNNKFYAQLPPDSHKSLRKSLMHYRAMAGASDEGRIKNLKDYIMGSAED